MGVASLFNLTFESSRKAIKEALTLYGARDDLLNSPRETLKTAYKFGFIDNSDIWLSMLKDRNESIRVYDSQKAAELILKIKNIYLGEFKNLYDALEHKIKNA